MIKRISFEHFINLLCVAFMLIAPFIGYWIMCRAGGTMDMVTYFTTNFGKSGNIVYTTLVNTFGSGGALQLFSDNGFVVHYLAYFINVSLVSVVIDLLLLVPRLCSSVINNWIDISRGAKYEK